MSERDQITETLLQLRMTAWESQDDDAAAVMTALCRSQIKRWVAIEKAARVMVEEFKDASQVCFDGPELDAINALRSALQGAGGEV